MNQEIENYLVRIEDLRGQMIRLLTGLPQEAMDWRPFEGNDDHSTNSLAVLAAHASGAEHFWIAEVLGGLPATRDRDAEFLTHGSSAQEIVHILERIHAETRSVLEVFPENDLEGTRQVMGRIVPVRWCFVHVIDHTALHLGHMQITYQLWSGGKTFPAPIWYTRIPTY